MMCIFSTPRLFAGVKELFPDDYAALRHDEEVLGFTLDNKRILMNLSVIHSLACVGRIKQQYIQYLLVSSTQMTYTQMIGIILLVHFMVLTVVHVRKKVVM